MSLAEIVRGPDRFERLEVDQWVIVRDKGPAGFQPGFRAVDARNPDLMYQLEVDVEDYPDLSSGAEMIGTTLYHAIGYHVVDVYVVNVDPARITIAPTATIRDGAGRRPYRKGDLDDVLKAAARNPDGTYRMTAGRFVEGEPLGNFRYYGTRPDDPNDIHPHEHRRELRGNRVFGAWLNHDDSRALNTLDMLVTEGGRKTIRHYMFDFGSLLGNTHGPARIRRRHGTSSSGSRRSPGWCRSACGFSRGTSTTIRGTPVLTSACSKATGSSRNGGSPSIRTPRSTTCGRMMPSGPRRS